jgi:NADH dehydrogenase
MNPIRVLIIGGGFGGVKCAKELRGRLPESAEVVLFNKENHLVFSPLLAEVVGSSINALDVVVPLRQLLPGVFCRTEEVLEVDLDRNEVEYEGEHGESERMHADHLVLACGSISNLNVVPGMADHAFPLKTLADAEALRSQVIEQMELAEVCEDPERRRWHLSFLIVGGGYSGAEAAGEINDLLRSSARYFTRWRAEDVKVELIHSRDQILPEISPRLREFARRKMEAAGVRMRLNARVASATSQGVSLEDGSFLPGATIVCTVGTSPAPMIERLNAPKEKGRLLTEPDLRVKGRLNAWAIGDCAYILNTRNGQPSATTGQFAEREGRACARNILMTLRGLATKPFGYKPIGELCSIGGHSAVADFMGAHLSGFLAWFMWRGVYLFKLPSFGRRLQVGFDWAWLLMFPRDLAHVRTERTDRVTHAHYERGDFIFQLGDPPSNFYVVEQGEVEVIHPGSNGNGGEVIAVLGKGSFFGERALLTDQPRAMSIRARTPVDVLVMGKNVFTQVSGALAPLRDALAQALNRRTVTPWKDRPEIEALLRDTPLSALMEPVPQPLLTSTSTLAEVGHQFVEHPNEFFYVSDDGQDLKGVITISDLIRARVKEAGPGTCASEIMTGNPVTVCQDDSCAVAANLLREYRLKNLPVVERAGSRKLVGCLRARRLLALVVRDAEASPR